MKKVLVLALIFVLTLSLAGCFGSKKVKTDDGDKKVTTEEKKDKEQKGKGEIDGATIDIKGVETIEYEGEDYLIVTMDYTNESGESSSFMSNSMITVFQDGIELSEEYLVKDEESYEYYSDSQSVDIMDGKTLEVQATFKLRNKEDLITVEVSDWFDDDQKVVEEFEF